MKETTTYKYAFGLIEQIKNANFDSMLVSDNLGDIRFTSSNGSGLALPEFTGVYQNIEYSQEEDEDAEEFRNSLFEKSFGDLVGGIGLSAFGGQRPDGIDHDLISVIYDSKAGWNPSQIRPLLGDSQRIALVSKDNLPDFKKKDTSSVLSKIWKDIRTNYAKQGEGREKRFTKKWGPTLRDLSNHLEKYGLTSSEYTSWNTLRSMQDKTVIF